MRFLVDLNLSPRLADGLRAAGHDVVHAADLGLFAAPDEVVLSRALQDERVVMSADSDFGTLLARSSAVGPSVLYLRRIQRRRVDELLELVLTSLPLIETALDEGSVVVLGDGTARIRKLPIL